MPQHLHQCQLGYDAAHKNIVHGSGASWNAVHFSQHASSSNHINDEVKVKSTVDCQKQDHFRNTAGGQVENQTIDRNPKHGKDNGHAKGILAATRHGNPAQSLHSCHDLTKGHCNICNKVAMVCELVQSLQPKFRFITT